MSQKHTSYVSSLLVVDSLEDKLALFVRLILMSFLVINCCANQSEVALISAVSYFSIEILHDRGFKPAQVGSEVREAGEPYYSLHVLVIELLVECLIHRILHGRSSFIFANLTLNLLFSGHFLLPLSV